MDSATPANGTKRVRPGRRLSLRQVVDLQCISFETAKGLSADFQETRDKEERARVASAISNLGKAWVSLQDAKREILGKPKAGVRKHAVEKKKPHYRPVWPEPVERPPAPADMPGPDVASKAPALDKPDDEVKWEMREGPPGFFTQLVIDSPAKRAEAEQAEHPPQPAKDTQRERWLAMTPAERTADLAARQRAKLSAQVVTQPPVLTAKASAA